MISTSSMTLSPIGHCHVEEGRFAIHLVPSLTDGLNGLGDFSHAIALWWAHEADDPTLRDRVKVVRPYTASDDDFGVFATRSQARPNPIGLSVFAIAAVDAQAGVVHAHYFDMVPGTPVLDIKPYFPASDHVAQAHVPKHFSHWPTTFERSAAFDWSKEFTG